MRERVAKAEANAIAAQRKAEFAKQLATIYGYDTDENWPAAREVVKRATEEANQLIGARCQELGIPRPFRPSLSEPYWFGRGENAVSQRRTELTRVAHSKIDQLLKQAQHTIERASVDIQTKLVADGLESAEAKAFLEAVPTADQLMPKVTVEEIQNQLAPNEDELAEPEDVRPDEHEA
jgi:hypothetical protein